MKCNRYTVLNTAEYDEWLAEQPEKCKVQILGRLAHIKEDGHFGDHKDVDGDVWELKWRSGRRVYYAYIEESQVLLLLGGNKNGQSKDIKKAKKILCKYTET
jgi:putative addiction module killer protein